MSKMNLSVHLQGDIYVYLHHISLFVFQPQVNDISTPQYLFSLQSYVCHEITAYVKKWTGMLKFIPDPGAHPHALFLYPQNCNLSPSCVKCIILEVEVDFPEKM